MSSSGGESGAVEELSGSITVKATGQKLLLTLAFVLGILLLRAITVGVAHVVTGRHRNERVMFWVRQGASITAAVPSWTAAWYIRFIRQ